MKILYIITKSNWGGAQRYVYDLATSISQENIETKVVFGKEERLKTELNKANIPTISIKELGRDFNLLLDIKVFLKLVRLFNKEKPDIVHLNSSKIGGLGALAARISGVPKIIFTGHGWAFNEDRSWFFKKIILFFHWITIILSHHTIAVSEKIKTDVNWLPFVSKKIRVVYNGIKDIEFVSKESARRFLLPQVSSPIWIGSIAELHPTKALHYAIESFVKIKEQFPNVVFIIMGEGDERKKLEEKIKKYHLENQVFLLGYVPDARNYLKALDIFILTSISEALAYVIIEAGFAELPVISSNVGGIPEIITDENMGILVPSKNPDLLSDALKQLLKNEQERMTMGQRLRERVVKSFTLEKMVEETLRIYRD